MDDKELLQAIGEIIEAKVPPIVEKIVQPIKDGLQGVKDDLQGVKDDLQGVKDDLQGFRQQTDKKMLLMMDMISEVKNEVLKTAIIIETEIRPDIKLLAEAHMELWKGLIIWTKNFWLFQTWRLYGKL